MQSRFNVSQLYEQMIYLEMLRAIHGTMTLDLRSSAPRRSKLSPPGVSHSHISDITFLCRVYFVKEFLIWHLHKSMGGGGNISSHPRCYACRSYCVNATLRCCSVKHRNYGSIRMLCCFRMVVLFALFRAKDPSSVDVVLGFL